MILRPRGVLTGNLFNLFSDADIDETKFFLHERMCANIVKKCQCGEIIQIEQMEEHIKDAHTDVNCKYCRKGFNKKKLVDHEKTCNAKLKTCRFCEMEISGYDIKDHEKTCGSKTETCSICKSQVMIIEFEDHTLSCSAKESNRLKNDQIAKEKIREDKIRRDREEEKKRIEEIQRNERRIEEEKRKNKEEKINEEIKKKAAEDKKRMEEKKEDKRKLEEENRRKVLKNEIRNNEITSNKPKFIDINKHSEISDSKDIIKNIIKNPIAEKKDIRVKTEITQSKIIYKNGTDYIDKNFKNNPQTTINNQNSKIESRASGIKIDKRIPVTLESKIKPNQPTHLKSI